MRRCVECKGDLTTGMTTVTINFDGREYVRLVRAQLCEACGPDAALISNAELERAELDVAHRLARNGEATPEAFRYMRQTLGHTIEELAALLGVAHTSVSRWERKEHELPRAAWLALAAMIDDKIAGRPGVHAFAEAADHPHEEHGRIQLEAVG